MENKNSDQLVQLVQTISMEKPADAFVKQLTEAINYLLLHDFEKLVYVLYRIDVNEKLLKQLLQENTQTDAADIIANLIIKRQQEKLTSKLNFKRGDNIAEEDKW
jgi:adenosine deaminase